MVYQYLLWLTTFGANLLPISNNQQTKILSGLKHGQEFNGYAMGIHEVNYVKGKRYFVRPFDQQNGVYQVCTTYNPYSSKGEDHSHEVKLQDDTCTYGKWEMYKIPCSHVMAVCIRESINAMVYIEPCYSLRQ